MTQDDRFLTIDRAAADGPKSGGAEGGNAQFDFLQDTDTSGMETYDEAEAFSKDGATVADRDTDQYENGLPAHREGLSSQKERAMTASPTNPELDKKKARVAAKIASALLPNGNSEAIENQAAILMKYLPPKALAATLERVWYDREGGRIAAERVAAKQQRVAMDEAALDEADGLMEGDDMGMEDDMDMEAEAAMGMEDDMGGDMGMMPATADDDMAELDDEDLDDLAEDMGDADADMDVEDDLGMEDDMMAEEAMSMHASTRLETRGKKLDAKPVKRTASAKSKPKAGDQTRKSPKVGTPRRQVRTASQNDPAKLSEVFGRHLGVPSADEMSAISELFSI